MKKFLCMILAFAMVFSFNVTSFADGPDADTVPQLGVGVEELQIPLPSTRSLSGYASKFVSASGQGSFTVYVSGTPGLKAGITFKTSCDESNSAVSAITIQRPNGGYIVQNAGFSANQERHFSFLLPTAGTYTIYFTDYIPAGATTHMQIWIY